MAPKATGHPFLVERKDHATDQVQGTLACEPVPRVGFTTGVSEDWLQELLDRAPALLPVEEIDERVDGPLFSLGREISTPAGDIDNLFISRSGHLVLVETKLWKNPEARRQAVAQVLDYAKHVRTWDYSQLASVVKKELWTAAQLDGIAEHEWIDDVNSNLARGRMTLLVVGDGIHSETEHLVEVVGAYPGLPFRLGLVELRIYRCGHERWFVVPSVLAKTVEIERAVVRIEPPGATGIVIETPVVQPGQPPRGVLSEEQFCEHLSQQRDGAAAVAVAHRLLEILNAKDSPLEVDWKSASFTIKFLDPVAHERLLSLCVVTNTGTLSTWLPDLPRQLGQLGYAPDAIQQITEVQRDVLQCFGATSSPSRQQMNIRLATLQGREADLVRGLTELAHCIQKFAPTLG